MDQLNLTVDSSNSSSPGLLPHPFWDSNRLVPAVVLSISFILGVPGNIAVMILRPNRHHLSSLSQSLMLNLAVSDLICLLTLPVWIYNLFYGWTLSLVSCKLLTFLMYCSIYGSKLTVTGLSVQRFLVVVHRQRYQQLQQKFVLVLLWLVAFILSIPSLVVRQLETNERLTLCRPRYSSEAQWVAVLMTEIMVGITLFFIVAVAYIKLHRKINQAAFFNNRQTTQLVTSIIVSFFVLWFPYHVINVVGVVAICLKNEILFKFCTNTWNIVGALTFINSCLNPLLYAFTAGRVCTICQNRKVEDQNSSNTSFHNQ